MQYSLVLAAAGVLFACLVYVVIYRLFLNPLATIPGPRLPAVTKLYSTYYDCFHRGGGQYPFKLKELHERYGPIIRPVPWEVHISDPDYLDTIYAIRDRNSFSAGGLMVDQSVGLTEDFALHKLRREALNPFFSVKAVINLEPLLAGKCNKLAEVLQKASQSGQPLNLSDVFFAFSNDILRSFCFGSDNGLLEDIPEANRQREDLASLLRGVPLNRHFEKPMRLMAMVMTLVKGQQALPAGLRDMLAFRARARQDIEAVLADKTNDRKGGNKSVFYELRDNPTLPPHEKTADRLQDEATLLVMAGTESTAKTLGIAAFYLLWLPQVMAKLRNEIAEARKQSASGAVSLSSLLAMPYLGAVIHEANRLSFGVTGRSVRYSPTETLTYTASYGPNKGTSYALPPGTRMSTVTYCTHTNESLFPDPWRFDPDHWLGNSEEVNRRKRCMHALGKGHRKCLGINLANAALSLALATVAEYDLQLFETNESDVKFKYDYQISHPKLDSKGVRAVVRSKPAAS